MGPASGIPHLSLHHDLGVLCPGVVTVAHPGTEEPLTLAAGLVTLVGRRVMVRVLVLAPAWAAAIRTGQQER
jgi:hypothetical protein